METRILSAPDLDFWVEVRLVSHQGRWIAVAAIAGDPDLGLGYSIRAAVRMALSSLGPHAVRKLIRLLPCVTRLSPTNVDTKIGTKGLVLGRRTAYGLSMQIVSVRVFRSNLTALAERAMDGEQVVVRRRSQHIALLRAATPREQFDRIGLREMRFGLGRCLRGVENGHGWLITFHGTPELVLTSVPDGLLPFRSATRVEDSE